VPVVVCQCEKHVEVPATALGKLVRCPNCQSAIRLVMAGSPRADLGDFSNRLVIEQGLERVGEQMFISGPQFITVGASPENTICLAGELVAYHQCDLHLRISGRWHVEDQKSANGTFVNSQRIADVDLNDGDVIDIGEYTLRFMRPPGAAAWARPIAAAKHPDETEELELAPAPLPPPVPRMVRPANPPMPTAVPVGPAPVCPSCKKTLDPGAIICVSCGINLKTGRPLIISRGIDENALYETAIHASRFFSWILPIGIFPIASEAFGRFRPYAIQGIALVTIIVTVAVWIANHNDPAGELGATRNLMLWAGDQPNPMLDFAARMTGGQIGEFHWYQLLTNVFLHGGILHIAGNLLFLLVFGNRVNALVGQWKAVVLYLLLGVLASSAVFISGFGKPLTPTLGASGAIMGMAGMYFVLMPTSRVYMLVWIRLGIFTAFRRFMKIFTVRGYWCLLFFLAFDIWATVRGSHDNVAHWAHLGGFLCGMAIALVMLITRQVNAHGGDILSLTLGPKAWKLLGTPAERAGAAGGYAVRN
jgi:membrane associated rhomboid family serine protease